MAGIYFTADTHMGHKNIVRGCSEWKDKEACRDFDTLEEHNERIIENINKTVSKDSILYHLGDWSMGGYGNVWMFRRRLNVETIHLILGNHDNAIRNNKIVQTDTGYINLQNLFTSVQEVLFKKIGGQDMVLFHYPIFSHQNHSRGAIHFYGHTHKELNYRPLTKCVSIDCHPEFRPFHLEELVYLTKTN